MSHARARYTRSARLDSPDVKSWTALPNHGFYPDLECSDGALGRETGYIDYDVASLSVDSGGVALFICNPAQGVGVNNRIGRKIDLCSVACNGAFYNGNSATWNRCSLLIVYDKFPNGSSVTTADVLNSVWPFAHLNDVNSTRFDIVARFDADVLGARALSYVNITSQTAVDCGFHLDLDKRPMLWKNDAAAVADVQAGALYAVMVGSTAVGGDAARFDGSFRTRFLN